MHLFAYGTLMFPEIWRRVVGRQFETQRATLAGFAAYRVRDGLFPVMVKSADDDRVDGLVYFDLDDATFARLDEHESDLYERIGVMATLDDGRSVECQAYVLPEHHRHFATIQRWTAQWFEQEAMDKYVARLWPS